MIQQKEKTHVTGILNKNMKYSRRNSFILLDEEKKEIRKLYEATTASASGSYSQPLDWKEETISPCEASALEVEVEGEDNIVDGSEELTIDADELMGMIGLSEEDEEARIRSLHRGASMVKEQEIPKVDPICLTCVRNALGRYEDKANTVALKIMEITADGEVTSTEFGSAITTILSQLGGISMFDLIPIGQALYGCVEKCKGLTDIDISMEI